MVFWIALLTVIGLGICFTLSFISRMQLNTEISELETEKQSASKDVTTFDTVSEQAQELATSAIEYNKIIAQQRSWSTFFAYIANTIPPNAYTTTISTANERETFNIVLSGIASDRTAVGLFREKILEYTYEDDNSKQRVSQALIDSIAQTEGGFAYTLRLTIDLAP